jgi:hypothetical protein
VIDGRVALVADGAGVIDCAAMHATRSSTAARPAEAMIWVISIGELGRVNAVKVVPAKRLDIRRDDSRAGLKRSISRITSTVME